MIAWKDKYTKPLIFITILAAIVLLVLVGVRFSKCCLFYRECGRVELGQKIQDLEFSSGSRLFGSIPVENWRIYYYSTPCYLKGDSYQLSPIDFSVSYEFERLPSLYGLFQVFVNLEDEIVGFRMIGEGDLVSEDLKLKSRFEKYIRNRQKKYAQ